MKYLCRLIVIFRDVEEIFRDNRRIFGIHLGDNQDFQKYSKALYFKAITEYLMHFSVHILAAILWQFQLFEEALRIGDAS